MLGPLERNKVREKIKSLHTVNFIAWLISIFHRTPWLFALFSSQNSQVSFRTWIHPCWSMNMHPSHLHSRMFLHPCVNIDCIFGIRKYMISSDFLYVLECRTVAVFCNIFAGWMMWWRNCLCWSLQVMYGFSYPFDSLFNIFIIQNRVE